MKSFAGVAEPHMTLVVALALLFTLAVLLVANSHRGQLQATQSQPEKAQGELQQIQLNTVKGKGRLTRARRANRERRL
jgi:hypothetical protein